MRILIIGFGSIAKKHLAALKAIDPSCEVSLLRRQANEDLGEFKPLIKNIYIDSAIAFQHAHDAVIITNPAVFHAEYVRRCFAVKLPVFVEKPLTANLAEAQALKQLYDQSSQPVVMVGYCMRFLKPLGIIKQMITEGRMGRIFSVGASVGQWLPDWRPQQPYQQQVSANAALGGGAILELSHEFDYLNWLLGQPTAVTAVADTVGNLGIHVEDMAEIIIRYHQGAIGHVHVDFLDKAAHRSCRIIADKGTLVWQTHEGGSLRWFDAVSRQWQDLMLPYESSVKMMYEDQMREFLACVKGKQQPRVGLNEALEALAIAEAAKIASLEKREVVL